MQKPPFNPAGLRPDGDSSASACCEPGDVHMLSHLAGADQCADIRRLREVLEERDRTLAGLQQELAASRSVRASLTGLADVLLQMATEDLQGALALVAVQAERRERAEQAAGAAAEEVARLREELEHLGRQMQTLNRGLSAAEARLREMGEGEGSSPRVPRVPRPCWRNA